MIIHSAKYIQSTDSVLTCPITTLPELAFIGRSNVGKSSLINFITGRNNLALTSSNPGKTRSINHFLINESWYLVDLPGYGYASVSRKERDLWHKKLWEYLINRENLKCVFVLIDSNIKPQAKDIEFVNKLGENSIPFTLVFTKMDKSKPNVIEQNISSFNEKLSEQWFELPKQFMSSVLNKEGKEEILSYVEFCITK